MKKLIVLILSVLCIDATAQITLDHTYPTAGFYGANGNRQVLELVDLEVDGEKFVFIDNSQKKVNFYHLNHSLWKTVFYDATIDVQQNYNNANIMYVSQHLFDLDDEIEFLYTDVGDSDANITQVVNEDGSILFTAEGQAPRLYASVPQAQVPIYNTSAGTFMILSGGNASDGNAYVYKLSGTLVAGIAPSPIQEMQSFGTSLAYPNPAMFSTRIDYTLPQGVHEGWLVFYNTEGQEVQRFQVDDTFTSIEVTTQDLSSGTYYYNLQTAQGASGGKKLVSIR